MKILLMVFVVLLSAQARAGGTEIGGGGQSVVCRRANGAVRSAQLLDLWEAETLAGQTPVPMKASVADIVDSRLQVLSKGYPLKASSPVCEDDACVLQFLRFYAKRFLSDDPDVRRLHGVTLPVTDDSAPIASPNGCKIEQVVNYQPSGIIFIDDDLFKKMDHLNQAALIAHEAFYALLRSHDKDTNSSRTRRAVGYAFAGHTFTTLPTVQEAGLLCASEGLPEYLPSSLVFTRGGSGPTGQYGLNTFVRKVFGARLIGLEKDHDSQPMVGKSELDTLFSGTCQHYQGMFFSMNIKLQSPVEYDRKLEITTECDNGKLGIYLMDTAPGTKASRLTELHCHEVDSSRGNQ
jgi:hypothetical protein